VAHKKTSVSTASSSNQLAIVIPAYKPDFLRAALESIAAQSDQRFNIYVCDDASPADIASIARSTLGARPYSFHRFENNLGGASLAKHWNRCVALTTEPWVWLFSDDDLMDNNCVEAFHKCLDTDRESGDILHFELWRVNEDSKVTEPVTVNVDQETWLEFAYGHFMGWRVVSSQNLIFRRTAFESEGGFLDLPSGWHVDAATTIAIGRHRAIRRIPGARVFWRSSQNNVSAGRSIRSRIKKLRAACLFLNWFHGQLGVPREHLFPDDAAAFQRAMNHLLVLEIMSAGLLPTMANWKLVSRTRVEVCHGSRLTLLKYIAMAVVNDSVSAVGSTVRALAGRSSR
jgi:glycosyltransferase involved in cell wall biosynthesis